MIKDFLYFTSKEFRSPSDMATVWHKAKLTFKMERKIDFPKTCSPDAKSVKIDLVIVVRPKDFELLEYTVDSLRWICHEVSRVFIVAPDEKPIRDFCSLKGCFFVPELRVLGYGPEKIEYKVGKVDRSKWVFQQLLKLNASTFVKEKRYLTLDADTVLIGPHSFVETDEQGREKIIFQESLEWHKPYEKAYERLIGEKYTNPTSFVSHMMLFDVDVVAEMKKEIEGKKKVAWDRAFVGAVVREDVSGISEFELYGHWLLARHPERVKMIPFYNRSLPRQNLVKAITDPRFVRDTISLSFHNYSA